jgi:hypothetical protein
MVDDSKVMYVAGHNVVIYSPEEQSQQFISGTEGVEEITAIAVSKKAHLLAICERGDSKAICSIFHLHSRKKQRVIPESDNDVSYRAKEFLGAAFCPKNPERYLVTLAGEPDWCVHLWQHDMFKCLARIDLSI